MTGLEALKVVEKDCEDLEQVPYGEFALIEKSLKALEIIKEKRVDVFRINYYITSNRISELEEYKRDRNLTEEEFNLLKEVFSNERN